MLLFILGFMCGMGFMLLLLKAGEYLAFRNFWGW